MQDEYVRDVCMKVLRIYRMLGRLHRYGVCDIVVSWGQYHIYPLAALCTSCKKVLLLAGEMVAQGVRASPQISKSSNATVYFHIWLSSCAWTQGLVLQHTEEMPCNKV